MKRNITLLLPLDIYKRQIAHQLAQKLNMLYVDINDLLKFELLDLQRVLDVAGKDYLHQQENKMVKRVASYSNAVITIDTSTLNQSDNIEHLKKHCLFVYLRFSQKDYLRLLKREKNKSLASIELDRKVFLQRDEFFKNHSDIVVECANTNKRDIIKEVIDKMYKFYGK